MDYGSSLYKYRFMKNFRFDTNCNIIQEQQELQIYISVGSSASLV